MNETAAADGSRASELPAEVAGLLGGRVLPPEFLLSWGLSTSSSVGRRRRHTVPEVVNAGIRVADRDGLVGVSMPTVARELGLTQNALYRYVPSKHALLVLMEDAATGSPPTLSGSTWRANAEQWALAALTLYGRRPWLLDLPVRAPITPNVLRWTESILHALRPLRLTVAERAECAVVLDGHARHQANLARAADPVGPLYPHGVIELLKPLLRADGCGEVVDFLDGIGSASGTPDDGFRFSLDRVLDGIEVLAQTRRRADLATP